MPLLRLANTVIDGVRANRAEAIAAILRFGENDLLCYRAEHRPNWRARQARNGTLCWPGRPASGARLAIAGGIGHVAQPPEALAALATRRRGS